MVTGAVGVAAYEALRKMVVKAPLRAATVSVATGFNVDAVRAVASVTRIRARVRVPVLSNTTVSCAPPPSGQTPRWRRLCDWSSRHTARRAAVAPATRSPAVFSTGTTRWLV